MIRSLKDLTSYSFKAKDDDVGRVRDFYFDDASWTVRYLVLETGKWLPGRRVLLSPDSIDRLDWDDRTIRLNVSKKTIEESPAVDDDAPVSRQHEKALHDYYGWRPYWLAGPAALGAAAAAMNPTREGLSDDPDADSVATATGDPHLRSVQEVTKYDIEALDGSLGAVSDLACGDGSWTIRYLVVDTRKWLPGKKVLVSPEWVDKIDWSEGQIDVGLTREQIKESPEFDPDTPINRVYEERLYDFYGRPRYWLKEDSRTS